MATRTTKKRIVRKEDTNVNDKGQILEEEEIVSNNNFDVNKYTIGNSLQEVTLLLGPDEDELTITTKDISWSKRNQIMSKCLSWDNAGNTAFDGDAYVRLCLKEIITEAPWGNTSFDGDAYVRLCLKEIIHEAPWGNTTEAFLIRINDDLGQALEQLVPRAFADDSNLSDEINSVKKGQ